MDIVLQWTLDKLSFYGCIGLLTMVYYRGSSAFSFNHQSCIKTKKKITNYNKYCNEITNLEVINSCNLGE